MRNQYSHIAGVEDAIAEAMHVAQLDPYDEAPDITT